GSTDLAHLESDVKVGAAWVAVCAALWLAACAELGPPTPTVRAQQPTATDVPAVVAVDTPAPTPTPTVDELAVALANPPPARDVADLARRFRIGPGTPTPLGLPAATPAAVGDAQDFWVADSVGRRYFRARARLTIKTDHVDFY